MAGPAGRGDAGPTPPDEARAITGKARHNMANTKLERANATLDSITPEQREAMNEALGRIHALGLALWTQAFESIANSLRPELDNFLNTEAARAVALATGQTMDPEAESRSAALVTGLAAQEYAVALYGEANGPVAASMLLDAAGRVAGDLFELKRRQEAGKRDGGPSGDERAAAGLAAAFGQKGRA